VNGQRVTDAVPLGDGDEVRLGSITLVFGNLAEPRPTETLTSR
jgi:pSer/pThr/pTyr-binding forkhead associated (FHA) protein